MSDPVNFRQLDPAGIDAAVEYALQVARGQTDLIRRLGRDLDGLSMLEIGPGSDFGPALIQASHGARVTVADRYLADWQDDYHGRFYRRLAEAYPGPTDQLLAAADGGYEATTLIRVAEPAEHLDGVASGAIDFVFSNAVLEHVVDFGAVAAEFDRITKAGGCGAHQIDLRDHRDFTRPLDHLTLAEDAFLIVAEDSHYECGNRCRASEFEAHFAKAGFAVVDQSANELASEDYLAELMPILRASRSAYRDWPAADLPQISVLFLVEKKEAPDAASLIHRGEVTLEMMARLKAQALAMVGAERL